MSENNPFEYFKPGNTRRALFPIEFQDLFDFYKKLEASWWLAGDIPYSEDLESWNTLSEGEQHFIKNVLAFFAESDALVNENLALNMIGAVPYREAEFFYAKQMDNETIHNETYSRLLQALVTDEREREQLLNAIENIPAVAKKAKWAESWINKGDIVDKLIAFAVVEGLLFSGSFCAIYYMNSRQKLPALSEANRYISIDEQAHCEFAVNLYRNYVLENKKKSNKYVQQIIEEALITEKEFIIDSLPVSLIGMNSDLMVQYLKYVANDLYQRLTGDDNPIYTERNPFPFMEAIAVPSKTNFFEKRVVEYQAAKIGDIKETDDF